jgi:hypothetical protein
MNPNAEAGNEIEKTCRAPSAVGRVTPCAPRLPPAGASFPWRRLLNLLPIKAFLEFPVATSEFGMNPRGLSQILVLLAALAVAGCASQAKARLREQNAFLAGQNAALIQQAQSTQAAGVTITGAVQHPQVPWVVGLTLAQAVATANFVGTDEPKQILITRQGETAALDAQVLLNGPDIPLEIGDVVELR